MKKRTFHEFKSKIDELLESLFVLKFKTKKEDLDHWKRHFGTYRSSRSRKLKPISNEREFKKVVGDELGRMSVVICQRMVPLNCSCDLYVKWESKPIHKIKKESNAIDDMKLCNDLEKKIVTKKRDKKKRKSVMDSPNIEWHPNKKYKFDNNNDEPYINMILRKHNDFSNLSSPLATLRKNNIIRRSPQIQNVIQPLPSLRPTNNVHGMLNGQRNSRNINNVVNVKINKNSTAIESLRHEIGSLRQLCSELTTIIDNAFNTQLYETYYGYDYEWIIE